MNNKNLVVQYIFIGIYLLLQTVFLHNVMLFNGAFCFIYVAILLLMPFATNTMTLLVMGFVIGFFVDMSYGVLGIHAAASVLLAYLRNWYIKRLEPNSGYEGGAEPFLSKMGLAWFAQYTLPLIFLHHIVVFFVEVNNASLFFITLWKVVGSTVFTFLVMVLIQYIFYKRNI